MASRMVTRPMTSRDPKGQGCDQYAGLILTRKHLGMLYLNSSLLTL